MKQKDKVRLVIMVSDEQKREIKSFSGSEGITITQAMLMGFKLLKNGGDGFAESMLENHSLDEKERAWAEKIIKGVDDAS